MLLRQFFVLYIPYKSLDDDLKGWTVRLRVDVIVELSVSASDCLPVIQPDSCPQFETPEPLLIPVGFEIPISFQGRNLDIYMVRSVTLTHDLNILVVTIVIIAWCTGVCVSVSRARSSPSGRSWWSSRRGQSYRSRGQSSNSQVMRSVQRTRECQNRDTKTSWILVTFLRTCLISGW